MNPLARLIPGNMGGAPSVLSQINSIKQMLTGRDPNAVAMMFAQKNPQFAQFCKDCRGKSPQQIAEEYGLDWNEVQNLLK